MKKRTLAALLTASAVLSACGAPAEPQPGESDAVIYYLLPAEEMTFRFRFRGIGG